jgi:hypothetical protein
MIMSPQWVCEEIFRDSEASCAISASNASQAGIARKRSEGEISFPKTVADEDIISHSIFWQPWRKYLHLLV